MTKLSNTIAFLLLITAILCVIYTQSITSFFNNSKDVLPTAKEKEVSTPKNKTQPELYFKEGMLVQFAINRPTPLSGKTKAEIYEQRKKYVENSIFQKINYEPSEEVFGAIEDRKPWVSTNVCHASSEAPTRTDGPSEETRFLNNPSILVGLEYPFTFSKYKDDSFCQTDETNIMPQAVSYDSTEKLITVTYNNLPFTTQDWSFYQFNGLNARDFGYKYIYLDKSKSTYNIEFANDFNISKGVYELNNYIHVGGSCGVAGGCNNGSPRQGFVEFKHRNYKSESGKTIYLKLWKEKPLTPLQKPDIIQKIIFL